MIIRVTFVEGHSLTIYIFALSVLVLIILHAYIVWTLFIPKIPTYWQVALTSLDLAMFGYQLWFAGTVGLVLIHSFDIVLYIYIRIGKTMNLSLEKTISSVVRLNDGGGLNIKMRYGN